MADLILLANEFGKHSAKFKGRFKNEDALWYLGWIAQPKYDGCFGIAEWNVDEGTATMKSRTGEDYSVSCENILAEILDLAAEANIRTGCLVGEVWDPKADFATISGRFRKRQPDADLCFVANDILPDCRVTGQPYAGRYFTVKALVSCRGHFVKVAPEIPYSERQDVWEIARGYVAGGAFDGLILRDPSAGYNIGRSKEGEIVKVKPHLSYTLRVQGVKEAVGARTGRAVYTLDVGYFGKVLGVGSGVPHALTDVPKVGDLVEIQAMGQSSKGLLREPRFVGTRADKDKADDE